MKPLLKWAIWALIFSSLIFAQPQSSGSVSVLLFSNGKPLINNEVKFDGTKSYQTDKDGNPKPRLEDKDNHTIDATRYAFSEDMNKVNKWLV